MSEVFVVNTDQAPAAVGPYSQALKWNDLLICSGQIPLDPVTGEIISGSIEDQTRQTLSNLKAVLLAGGSSLDKVLKIGIFLKDMNDFSKVNAIYQGYFTEPYPARACVEVARLPKDVAIEIEAWAYVLEK